jgi:citronellol/citronellal dehydrogenase
LIRPTYYDVQREEIALSAVPFVLAADANAGSVALISGGGTGIGRATALALCRSGADVVVCGRRPEPLEATRHELEALGGSCLAVSADIREPDDVERVIEAALERFGAVDVVVNNAGGQFVAPAEEISDNGWRAVQRLAVDAAWSLTRRAAVHSMIPRRRGVVVFIGFSPRRGVPGMAHASAARAAVENLAGALACEWSRFGIRAVCVAPGNIETDALARYDPADVAAWTRGVPLGRLGTADEVGTVIAFLASPGGSYVTGTTIVVDGGVDAWGQGVPPPLPVPLGESSERASDGTAPSTRPASSP